MQDTIFTQKNQAGGYCALRICWSREVIEITVSNDSKSGGTVDFSFDAFRQFFARVLAAAK